MYDQHIKRLCIKKNYLFIDNSINSIIDKKISIERVEKLFNDSLCKALSLYIAKNEVKNDFKFTFLLTKGDNDVDAYCSVSEMSQLHLPPIKVGFTIGGREDPKDKTTDWMEYLFISN